MTAAMEKALQEVDALVARLSAEVQRAQSAQPVSSTKDGATKDPAAAEPPTPVQVKKRAESTLRDNKPGALSGKAAAKQAKAAAKKEQLAATPASSEADVLAEMFGKARLAVGQVKQAEVLPDSDKLFRCQVQVGGDETETRQIIAGLRKHISQEDLQGRLVTCILNLKTAKLAGEASEGMILAAVHKGDTFEHGELVKPLSVPEGCQPGDPVFLEGRQQLGGSFPKEFKHWKRVLPHLAVKHAADGCVATFDGTSLVTSFGAVRVDAAMPDGAAIS